MILLVSSTILFWSSYRSVVRELHKAMRDPASIIHEIGLAKIVAGIYLPWYSKDRTVNAVTALNAWYASSSAVMHRTRIIFLRERRLGHPTYEDAECAP